MGLDLVQLLEGITLKNGDTLVCPADERLENIIELLSENLPRPMIIEGGFEVNPKLKVVRVVAGGKIVVFPTYVLTEWIEREWESGECRDEFDRLHKAGYKDVRRTRTEYPCKEEDVLALLEQYPELSKTDFETARNALVPSLSKQEIARLRRAIDNTPRCRSVQDIEARIAELEDLSK